MQRILVFFAIILSAVSTWACPLPDGYIPIKERAPKALLFKVSGCNQPVRYVFGTYHSDAAELAPILAHVQPYLWQSKRLWVEIVSAPELISQTQQWLLLPPQSPNLQQLVGDATYAQIKERLMPLLQLPEETIQRFKPWAVALLVQYPAPSHDGIILDVKLQQLAARKAIGVSGLERLSDQFAIFNEMPEPLQRDFLRLTLAQLGSLQSNLAALQTHYLTQNIWAIDALNKQQFDDIAKESPELADYLMRRLIVARNAHMLETMLSRMNYTAFVAVGALHLTGDTGLLAQLEQRGMVIEPVFLQKQD